MVSFLDDNVGELAQIVPVLERLIVIEPKSKGTQLGRDRHY
jgi:hypothetical protein